MTPEQQLNAMLVFGPLGLTFFSEIGLLFFRPQWLAQLAFVPVGRPHRLVLMPAARAVFTRNATYRDTASGALDLSPLAAAGATLEIDDGTRVHLDADGRRASFRLPFGPMFAAGGACAVSLRANRDSVTLEARAIPALALSGMAFFMPIILMALRDPSDESRVVLPILIVIFASVEIVGAFRTRSFHASRVDAVIEALARHVASIG